MKTVAGRFIIAVLLFAGGARLPGRKPRWRAASPTRIGASPRCTTTPDDRIGDARSALDRLPLPMETLGAEVQRHRDDGRRTGAAVRRR